MTKGSITTLALKFAATRFRFDSRLAIEINSPARYSERTMQLLKAASSYIYYVSDLFRTY